MYIYWYKFKNFRSVKVPVYLGGGGVYCCFEVSFLLGILLKTLDVVVLEESSLGLNFSKHF